MTAQMAQLSELIDSKVEATMVDVEARWLAQFKKFDEPVKAMEAEMAAGKKNAEKMAVGLSELVAGVEKTDTRNVALMKKLHGIHAQELEDKTAALRQEQQSAMESLHGDLRVQSRELIRLKAQIDEALEQGGAKVSAAAAAAAADESLSTLVNDIGLRVGKLETRLFLRDGSPGGGGGGGGGGDAGGGSRMSAAASREDKLQLSALREGLAELSLQMNDIEAEQSYLSGAVKSISASMQADKQRRLAQGLGEREDEVVTLQRKIQGVGKHASKAIRGLSEGMQDIQHSILALYSWSNSVNAKLYLPLMSNSPPHQSYFSVEGLGPGPGPGAGAGGTATPAPENKEEQPAHVQILHHLRASSEKLRGSRERGEQWSEL